MTEHKHLKQLVRSRMQKTGESYSTARRQLVRQAGDLPTTTPKYRHFPGSIAATTALRDLLAHAGVRAPHTGQPFSEAMVFGLAGGIGAGMFAFHYAKANFSSFFVAGRHMWQDHLAWAQAAVERLGLTAVVKESSGVKPAEKQLRELLTGGRPVLAWLDASALPISGGMYSVTSVHSIDDAAGTALLGDLVAELVPVPLPELAVARGRTKKDKNRLLALEPAGKTPRLEQLVRGGIAACAGALTKGRMKNFTLQAFATWSDRLDGSKAPDAWEKIFPPGALLYTGLKSITEFVEYYGTGGGLCRPMFADFLDEAATALQDRDLAALSARYAELGRGWSELADAALPDAVPAFRNTRELIAAGVDSVGPEAVQCGMALEESMERMREEFPLDAAESAALRRDLKRRVTALYEGEMAAAVALASWL
ncbi:MAG TPA: DUF4872 domain-containing protein [Gemmatimonadales bacterium]|nr:DUF4872 domain-containing protein [Gemmatimonadales bacterium]